MTRADALKKLEDSENLSEAEMAEVTAALEEKAEEDDDYENSSELYQDEDGEWQSSAKCW